MRPQPPGRRSPAPKPPLGPQPLTDVIVEELAASLTLGQHPIMDTLLSWLPENSYVRELFAPATDYERQLYAVARPLEPSAVHDPVRVITQVRVISSTPTGSLMLDMGPSRSVAVGGHR